MSIATLAPTISSSTWICGIVREIERRPDYPSYDAGYTEKHEEGEYQLERAVSDESAQTLPISGSLGWICVSHP